MKEYSRIASSAPWFLQELLPVTETNSEIEINQLELIYMCVNVCKRAHEIYHSLLSLCVSVHMKYTILYFVF